MTRGRWGRRWSVAMAHSDWLMQHHHQHGRQQALTFHLACTLAKVVCAASYLHG